MSETGGINQASEKSEQWMNNALCIYESPATFFPPDGAGVEAAKEICKKCVVREDCLEFALQNRIDHGVWGGQSERGRRLILKQRHGRNIL